MATTAGHVWLYNEETEGYWECPDGYAYVAKARGWVTSDPPEDEYEEPQSLPVEEPEEEQTGYNPTEHGFKDVLEYLAQYRDSAPGEVERVLSIERANKNRKSITGE